MSLAYHSSELGLIRDLKHPKRIVPLIPFAGCSVLDVGCGAGQTLTAPEFASAGELHGIDSDEEAVTQIHRTLFGDRYNGIIHLNCAKAEKLFYNSKRFDLVFSRVAMPYTNIPQALAEMYRVLKPGGHLWISLHPWSLEPGHILTAIKKLSVKRLIDRAYVALNSVIFSLTGKCFARPWNRDSFETVQTKDGIFRALRRAGFQTMWAPGYAGHFVIIAIKAAPMKAARPVPTDKQSRYDRITHPNFWDFEKGRLAATALNPNPAPGHRTGDALQAYWEGYNYGAHPHDRYERSL